MATTTMTLTALAKPDSRPNADSKGSLHDFTYSSSPRSALPHDNALALAEATSSAFRQHFSIGTTTVSPDTVAIISHPHQLLPVLVYGIAGAGGHVFPISTGSTASEASAQLVRSRAKVLCCTEATKYVALNAAEEAGWGLNGGGRVAIMRTREGEEWGLRVVQGDFQLGKNIVDVKEK